MKRTEYEIKFSFVPTFPIIIAQPTSSRNTHVRKTLLNLITQHNRALFRMYNIW